MFAGLTAKYDPEKTAMLKAVDTMKIAEAERQHNSLFQNMKKIDQTKSKMKVITVKDCSIRVKDIATVERNNKKIVVRLKSGIYVTFRFNNQSVAEKVLSEFSEALAEKN